MTKIALSSPHPQPLTPSLSAWVYCRFLPQSQDNANYSDCQLRNVCRCWCESLHRIVCLSMWLRIELVWIGLSNSATLRVENFFTVFIKTLLTASIQNWTVLYNWVQPFELQWRRGAQRVGELGSVKYLSLIHCEVDALEQGCPNCGQRTSCGPLTYFRQSVSTKMFIKARYF